MKVVVEFDLPEGQSIPDPRDIVRLTDPNWISDWWHISDVEDLMWNGKDITDEDCQEILRRVDKYKDANIGINWETIQCHIDSYLEELGE
jgi:hypothetical protein